MLMLPRRCLQIIMESLQKSSRRGRCSLPECEIVWRINFNVQPRIDRRSDGSLDGGRSSFKEHLPWDTPRVRSGRGAGTAASACTELQTQPQRSTGGCGSGAAPALPSSLPPRCLLAASSLPLAASSLPSSPSSLRGWGRAAPGPLPEGQRSGRPGAGHSRSSDAGAEQTCRKLGPCCRHSLAGLEGSLRVGSPGPSKRPVAERPGRAPWLGGAGLLQFANVVQILSL